MKSIVFCICMTLALPLLSQSKKELQAEVNKLKAELEAMKKANAAVEASKAKAADLTDPDNKASYCIGVIIGSNMKMQGLDSLNAETFSAALRDVLGNSALKVDRTQAESTVQQYMQQVMEQKGAKAREAGEQYLEKNKASEGVKVTASGLQYKVIKAGAGKTPTSTDKVTVHYTGKLTDGTVFDSSVERGEPITFDVSGVIPGWTEILQLMKEGDKWMVYIPYSLAYGERGAGAQIPPYSTLIFEIELLKVN